MQQSGDYAVPISASAVSNSPSVFAAEHRTAVEHADPRNLTEREMRILERSMRVHKELLLLLGQ